MNKLSSTCKIITILMATCISFVGCGNITEQSVPDDETKSSSVQVESTGDNKGDSEILNDDSQSSTESDSETSGEHSDINNQTIAAGSDMILGIKRDTNEVRVDGPDLRNSFYDFADSNSALLHAYEAASNLNDVIYIDCYEYFAAVKKDRTVKTGYVTHRHGKDAYEVYGLAEADNWTDISKVTVGLSQIVGLKTDGTVLTVGYSASNFSGIDTWTDIIDIDAGEYITVGLKSDGTVVTCDTKLDVSSWTDIVSVSCSSNCIIGLKSDGTVVAVSGRDNDPRVNVSEWSDIISVEAGLNHTVGLKSDGTVVSTKIEDSEYDKGQTDVEAWSDIVEISANYISTVGLKSDGTIVFAGQYEQDKEKFSIYSWNDILIP